VDAPESHTVLLHKPLGCVTARRDASHPTVLDCLPPEYAALHPVGRLDRDTEGLLLLTDDGRLTAHLTHPSSHVPKTYAFWAIGELSEAALLRLRSGLLLLPDPTPTLPAEAEVTAHSTLYRIAAQIPPAYRERLLKNRDLPVTAGTLTVCEGRTHQVRRMLRAVGCSVIRLQRIALGPLTLGDLPPGAWRELTQAEVAALWKDVTPSVRES